MKILVCVSKVPDTTTKISFTDGGKQFNTAGVQYIMNPYDEWYALVRALELTEASGGTVTLINVGSAENDAIIRKGLAIGATDAIRVDAEPGSSYQVAAQIAGVAKSEGYDLILTGKETIDYNASEVGAMIAEFLDLPYVSYANQLEMDGNTAVVSRDIEGGTEAVSVSLPLVISAAKGMAEQRIPNMRGIMMAKTKPIKVVPPTASNDPAVVVQYELPPAKSSVKLIDPDNMDELVRLLHEEAKVI